MHRCRIDANNGGGEYLGQEEFAEYRKRITNRKGSLIENEVRERQRERERERELAIGQMRCNLHLDYEIGFRMGLACISAKIFTIVLYFKGHRGQIEALEKVHDAG